MNIRVVIIFLAFISFIGGFNWFITAVKNMSTSSKTNDIFTNLIPQKFTNLIYITIFLCNLILMVCLLYPTILNKVITSK